MNNNITITVIIPVFNAGSFLRLCIESVSNQTLRSIEIIIVNDGSTDNSIDVIKELQLKDSRIKIIDGPNQGVSVARNIGLSAATGDYIGFVDADDWIEPNMFEILLTNIINNNADLAVCNIKLHNNGDEEFDRLIIKDEVVDLGVNKKLALNNLFDFKYDYANWNKLYKRSIVLKHKIIFHPGMKIWEDLLFNLKYIHFADKLSILNQSLYHYRIHDESVMKKSESVLIEQYNFLYCNYREFCTEQYFKEDFVALNYKMAEAVYNNLFPRFAKKISSENSFFTAVKLKSALLMKFVPEIFIFKNSDLKGYQGFKKRLLLRRNYYLFSFLDSCRNLFIS